MRDLNGKLGVFDPIVVMQMLNLAQATGELELEIERNIASVFFDRGNVTFAGIANRPMKLGEQLLKDKRISKKDLNDILKKKRGGMRLGTLLIDAGIISEAELQDALQEQIKEVIYEIVRWRDGHFVFHDGKLPKSQEILIDIPLDHLMLEGLKRLDEEREKI